MFFVILFDPSVYIELIFSITTAKSVGATFWKIRKRASAPEKDHEQRRCQQNVLHIPGGRVKMHKISQICFSILRFWPRLCQSRKCALLRWQPELTQYAKLYRYGAWSIPYSAYKLFPGSKFSRIAALKKFVEKISRMRMAHERDSAVAQILVPERFQIREINSPFPGHRHIYAHL